MKLLPVRQVPQNCHWSVPTLLMPAPYWLSAGDAQWSCWNDQQILVLDSTEICATCPMWKERHAEAGKADAVPPQGAMAFHLP